MKSYISRKTILIVIAILTVTLIVIPVLLIGLCHIYDRMGWSFFPWSANAVLGFYGAIFAAVATVVGVFLSIQYAQRNYREDLSNKVRPYISITHLRTNAKRDDLFSFFEEAVDDNPKEKSDEAVTELIERPGHIYYVIQPDCITDKRKLTAEQMKLIEKAGQVKHAMRDGGFAIGSHAYTHIPMDIENVGLGAAINLRVRLIKAGDEEKNIGYNIFGTVHSGNHVRVTVFSDEEYAVIMGKYKLQFLYQDIYNNCFSQVYEMILRDKDEDGQRKWEFFLNAPQKEIEQ